MTEVSILRAVEPLISVRLGQKILHYNYYRTYDPATGRYLESDPIGLAAGPNTYSYVGNMPTTQTDRYGLENDMSARAGLPLDIQRNLLEKRQGIREFRKKQFDGLGDTSICSYYDKLSNANPRCGYFPQAAQICRGGNLGVNNLIALGLLGNGQRNTQSQALDSIRQSLIESDAAARSAGNIDDNGCTCGDNIDQYHEDAFRRVGFSRWLYGGNLLPQDTLANPVPYDPRGDDPIDDLFN